MQAYTLTDAHGNDFIPHEAYEGIDWTEPDEVWIHDEQGGGAWVPWSIARQYPPDVTVEQIEAQEGAS